MEALLAEDPQQVGPYKIVGRLGAGGMGQVFLGVSPTADRVAVKVIKSVLLDDADFRERFALEVVNLKTVYGARVARFEGAGLDDEPPWLAVEYIEGPTLKRHVERSGTLDVTLAAMLGAQLADGLGKIHEAGVLHRDLKPQNILLGKDGPKVIDFGLAKVLLGPDHQVTEPGHWIGTLAYMSPEQVRADNDLDASTDVYALGATLAYAVTGRLLYPGPAGIVMAHRISDPVIQPDLTGAPPELVPLLGLMLAHEPTARPGVKVVHDQLIALAKASGQAVSAIRRRLIKATFDAPPPIVVPPELSDPRADPEDAGDRPDPTPEPPKSKPTEADVSWLADELRAAYARDAAF
ncbi:serine/threonine-protein kinase [Actinoplanes sp. NPDC023936]|uniref:serine/threonine protein kinase n=1 Tax=Actinoplanes sp. NPDC023936 TaxID=3154910 RepID=UPI0033CAF73A